MDDVTGDRVLSFRGIADLSFDISLGPGVTAAIVREVGGALARFVRIEQGVALPRLVSDSDVIIVQGALCAPTGRRLPPGTFVGSAGAPSLLSASGEGPVIFFESTAYQAWEGRDGHRRPEAGVQPSPGSIVVDPDCDSWQVVRGAAGEESLRRLLLRGGAPDAPRSMLVRFAPGWASQHGRHAHSVDEETVVIDGAVEVRDDGARFEVGGYQWKPRGSPQSPPSTDGGALVYIASSGAMDFRPLGSR